MAKSVKTAKRTIELPEPHFVHVMAEIERESERGAVLVAGAFLDVLLREVLETKFLPDDAFRKLLFEDDGPIQPFSTRIHLAYGLGFFGYRAYEDLKIIKDIRNAFAHSPDRITFENADVVRLCRLLGMPDSVKYGERPMPKTPRERFMRAFELLVDGLVENMARAQEGIAPSHFLWLGRPKPIHEKQAPSPGRQPRQSHPNGPRRERKNRK